MAALIGLSIIFGWRLLLRVHEKTTVGSTSNKLIVTGLIGALCALTAVIGAWAMFSDTSVLASLERRLDAKGRWRAGHWNWTNAHITRGGSIAIIIVLLTRAMTESTISPNAILGSEFFAMMAYFIYIIDRGAKPASRANVSASGRARVMKVAGVG